MPDQPTMRAKMRVSNAYTNSDGSQSLTFSAVAKNEGYPADGSDENNTFARFTPSATVSMLVQNPALAGKFEIGQEFYVDFTPATKPA